MRVISSRRRVFVSIILSIPSRYERISADAIPSYDDGAAFLVEFQPAQLPMGLGQRIFELRRRGKLPVIAHPERYQPLWTAPAQVLALKSECALVVDLESSAWAKDSDGRSLAVVTA